MCNKKYIVSVILLISALLFSGCSYDEKTVELDYINTLSFDDSNINEMNQSAIIAMVQNDLNVSDPLTSFVIGGIFESDKDIFSEFSEAGKVNPFIQFDKKTIHFIKADFTADLGLMTSKINSKFRYVLYINSESLRAKYLKNVSDIKLQFKAGEVDPIGNGFDYKTNVFSIPVEDMKKILADRGIAFN